MQRYGRSRSPRCKVDTVKLTSKISGFGRYPQNRPEGLQVQRDGSMKLKNLMNCWGEAAGFTKEEVLQALSKHMVKENGALRFGITGADNQDVIIKVFPKQRSSAAQGDFWAAPHSTTPRSAPPSTPRSRGGRRVVVEEGPATDERQATFGDVEVPAPGWRSCRFEDVSKWISWVLRAGYRDFGVKPWDGWLELDALSANMPERIGRFGKGELEACINKMDSEGRFCMWRGWITKVPHDRRRSRRTVDANPAAWAKVEEQEDSEDHECSEAKDDRSFERESEEAQEDVKSEMPDFDADDAD